MATKNINEEAPTDKVAAIRALELGPDGMRYRLQHLFDSAAAIGAERSKGKRREHIESVAPHFQRFADDIAMLASLAKSLETARKLSIFWRDDPELGLAVNDCGKDMIAVLDGEVSAS